MFHGFIPHIMGTRFDILLIHSDIDRLNTLWADIAYELERLDKILNRFDPHSEVSKINNHASQSKIQISKELKSILQLCSYYYQTTSHLFDITLKDFSRIQLHEHSYISFTSPDISLDFGGFAKGYALKKIRKLPRAVWVSLLSECSCMPTDWNSNTRSRDATFASRRSCRPSALI